MILEPLLPEHAKKTYSIRAPRATHFRKASCAEVDCAGYLHGFRVRLEGLPPELVHTAKNSGRRWREVSVSGTENYLEFEAGQACFQEQAHELPVGRPELFIVRDGDLRTVRPTNVRVHKRAEDWADDFATHQQMVADAIQEG